VAIAADRWPLDASHCPDQTWGSLEERPLVKQRTYIATLLSTSDPGGDER
jgi:hypothetical protein